MKTIKKRLSELKTGDEFYWKGLRHLYGCVVAARHLSWNVERGIADSFGLHVEADVPAPPAWRPYTPREIDALPPERRLVGWMYNSMKWYIQGPTRILSLSDIPQWHTTTPERLLEDYTHLDGTKCGVLE